MENLTCACISLYLSEIPKTNQQEFSELDNLSKN